MNQDYTYKKEGFNKIPPIDILLFFVAGIMLQTNCPIEPTIVKDHWE